MRNGIAYRLARGDTVAIATCVVVGILVLRVGASDTMDAAGTAVFAAVIGGLALGGAIRRVGGDKGRAARVGFAVGAFTGAADAVIGSIGTCAGVSGVHQFLVKSPTCASPVIAVLVTAAIGAVVVMALAFVGATGTSPSE